MEIKHKRHIISERLREELIQWQSKVDNAILQMNVGTREVKLKIQPHVRKLELELFRAKELWQELYIAYDNTWEDISIKLKTSFASMQKVYNQADKYFGKHNNVNSDKQTI